MTFSTSSLSYHFMDWLLIVTNQTQHNDSFNFSLYWLYCNFLLATSILKIFNMKNYILKSSVVFQNQFHCQFCHFYLTKNLFWFSIFYDFHPKQEKQNNDTSSKHWRAHEINNVSFHLICNVYHPSLDYTSERFQTSLGVCCAVSQDASALHIGPV